MDGTHGKTTFEGDPEQHLLRCAAHGKIGTMAVQDGNKMQMLGMIQPSYLPEIQIWLVTEYFRQYHRKNKVCNTNRRMTLRDSREMNYGSMLQNMSWFC